MANNKHIEWLYRELPDWVKAGLITEEQKERLQEYYGPVEKASTPGWATAIVAILGVLLIGGGIILIFAYNWDDLSRAWRTVLSFAPLVLAQLIYGYAFFRRQDSPAWKEGASTFLFLMIGACIALISQTYHIAGTMDEYLLSWALLSIPLMYLMNASLPAVLYLTGIAWWATYRGDSATVAYWGLLAAAMPHLYLQVRPRRSPLRRNVLGWALTITFPIAWFWIIEPEIKAYSYIGTALILGVFHLGGQRLNLSEKSLIRLPFRTVGTVGMFIFSLILSFRFKLEPNSVEMLINGLDYEPWAARINLGILIGLFIGYMYLFLAGFARRGPVFQTAAVFPFVVLLYVLMQAGGAQRPSMVLANLFTFAFGLAYLVSGIRHRHMGRVNVGLLFILILAAVRFFDTDWSYVVKGVAFVLLGIGFLTANWILSRQLK